MGWFEAEDLSGQHWGLSLGVYVQGYANCESWLGAAWRGVWHCVARGGCCCGGIVWWCGGMIRHGNLIPDGVK